MKYIIITAKHHDGFAMFRSKAHPFNIYDATPFKRDPLAELAAACKKAGMKFGFYYSHDQDWSAPGGAVIGKTWDKAQEGNFADYIHKKALPQFKELLNNYQPFPDVIWFDTPTTDMTPELATEFINLIKPAHPNLIWNERLGGGFKGNYRTPENHIPDSGMKGRDGQPEDWEVCMTMNNTWGFKKDDQAWKSTETLVRYLTDIASKGGNLLLNVGPTGEGLIPAPSVERLAEVGRWMTVNGEGIYGTTASPFKKQPFWGRITRKGDTLYLHVFTWPKDGKLTLPAANAATQARLLASPTTRLVTSNSPERGLEITLPATAPDRISSVIAVTLAGPLQEITPPPIAQAADGSLALPAATADIVGDKLKVEGSNEPNLGYWSNPGAYPEWRITMTRPGVFTPTLTYACNDKDAGSEFTLAVGDQKIAGKVTDTGGWKNYRTVTLGQLRIDRPGAYTVSLKVTRKGSGNVMNLRTLTLAP
jgi:alpha-L-fucosidase